MTRVDLDFRPMALLRRRCGTSQATIAAELGVSRAAVSHLGTECSRSQRGKLVCACAGHGRARLATLQRHREKGEIVNESTAPTAAEADALLSIARNLKAARTRAGLSQRALGELVNLDKSAICRYESGSRVPAILTMVAISRALGRPDFELFPRVPGVAYSDIVTVHEGNGTPVRSIGAEKRPRTPGKHPSGASIHHSAGTAAGTAEGATP